MHLNHNLVNHRLYLFLIAVLGTMAVAAQRTDRLLSNWVTVMHEQDAGAYEGFEQASFIPRNWKNVSVPHNWDDYYGYRRQRHGNLHGYAWYRTEVRQTAVEKGKRYFLFFEGVGSKATVWVNGQRKAEHAGGRTTFTVDITDVLRAGTNLVAVRADHPAGIQDLPWVCGGWSEERGFSEGSQPLGIFRPVHLVTTSDVRVPPFGVHVWNDSTANHRSATLRADVEIQNYSAINRNAQATCRVLDRKGREVARRTIDLRLAAGKGGANRVQFSIEKPNLWSLENPYRYKLVTEIHENGKLLDRDITSFGIRTIQWLRGSNTSRQFLLNGKPVFINGIGEYEHSLGTSHAFTEEEINARVKQIRAAGFNAFRDAHHPHNLRYQHYWDSLGLLWWTQLSAHVWYDTPQFREQFKAALVEWVRERRNSPSVVLWGLQNESKLPEDFARECTELVRKLDPTASSQRLVVTCNGGSGTDWDVPQNWTGTYGGDPLKYDEDLRKQVLVGEYGAWRTMDLHTGGGFVQNGPYSEERFAQLMEMKVRLGEKARDSAAGHFHWIFSSHDNPGRVQGGEGLREVDRIGPVNYKGLLTPWGEPTDAYYMFRSNYVSPDKEPMVYIAGQGWLSKWSQPAVDQVVVYSNCDSVALFNGDEYPLGVRQRQGIGTHFTWENVSLQRDNLRAVGYRRGKIVQTDEITLHVGLPSGWDEEGERETVSSAPGYHYLYRVNCGGPEFTDQEGNTWMADQAVGDSMYWGARSWAHRFKGLHPFFASQRRQFNDVKGTSDDVLFQTFRYGRRELSYRFPVPDGRYRVELYFAEPWWGRSGIEARGLRQFDVAVNEQVVIRDLDPFREAGYGRAIRKQVEVQVKGGVLRIHFPNVKAGQALLSAIAISSRASNIRPASAPPSLFRTRADEPKALHWLDIGDFIEAEGNFMITELPSELYAAQWLAPAEGRSNTLQTTEAADLFIGIDSAKVSPQWLTGFDKTGKLQTNGSLRYEVYRKRMRAKETITIPSSISTADLLIAAQPATSIEPAYDLKAVANYKAVQARFSGAGVRKGQVDGKDRVWFEKAADDNVLAWTFDVGVGDVYSLTISYQSTNPAPQEGILQLLNREGQVMKEEGVVFTASRPGKSNYITTNTGSQINAGRYQLILKSTTASGIAINGLDVQ